MAEGFSSFVMFADMRTGSNFLETNLNALGDVTCFGEAFNPNFIGYPKRNDLLGLTREAREADPERLLDAIRAAPGGLGGFRYFHDHDARVFDLVMTDLQCAKIVLTRNPLDSYVSRKIAAATGQWKLTDVKRRKVAKAVFDAAEFIRHVEDLQAFQARILARLQTSGQSAFFISYEDLQDVEVLNGLAAWLGVRGRLKRPDQSLKPQNPVPVSERVENPEEMRSALTGLDRFNLSRTPNFEPRRGPAVPGHVAAARAPLLFMPVRGAPEGEIIHWLAALDGVTPRALETGMNQKRLRQWKRSHPGHRSFTVLRHPLARAHAVFCAMVRSEGAEATDRMRDGLMRQFRLKLPEGGFSSLEEHRRAFAVFLDFAQANMAGQTALAPDAALCSQSSVVSGFGEFVLPDFVLREDELTEMLPVVARLAGCDEVPGWTGASPDRPFGLREVRDDMLEKKAAQVYRRDFLMFGFGAWREPQAA